MLVLLPMTSTLVKYRGWYSDFNRPFNISSAYFRCFLSGRSRRHFQQPLSLGEGANMCRNDVRNVRSWQVKCVWRFPHMWTILCFYYYSQVSTFSTSLNTLRTGDADLGFYITAVQDGWRKSAFLTRACFPCTIHLIMQYIEPVSEWSCWRMFIETWPHSELTFRHRASSI